MRGLGLSTRAQEQNMRARGLNTREQEQNMRELELNMRGLEQNMRGLEQGPCMRRNLRKVLLPRQRMRGSRNCHQMDFSSPSGKQIFKRSVKLTPTTIS